MNDRTPLYPSRNTRLRTISQKNRHRGAVRKIKCAALAASTVIMSRSVASLPALASSDPEGYIYDNGNEINFIQMTDEFGLVNGTIYIAYISNGQVITQRTNVSGDITNGQITLQFGTEITSVEGTYSLSELNLDIPQKDGNIADVTFVKASISTYNKDLSRLRTAADFIQKSQQQLAAEQEVDSSVKSIASDESAIQRDIKVVSSDLSVMRHDIGTESSTLKKTSEEEQLIVNESKKHGNQQYALQNKANQMWDYASNVQRDAGAVTSDGYSFHTDMSSLSTDVQYLNGDYSALMEAHLSVPKYRASEPRKELSKIRPFLSSVQQIIEKDKHLETLYMQKSAQMINQANNDADVATNAANHVH